MDSLNELRRRKAELKAQIALQNDELKKTVAEIRAEFEPGQLLKKAIGGALGVSKSETGQASSGILSALPANLVFLIDLLFKDPKLALPAKLLTSLALKYWLRPAKPKTTAPPETALPEVAPSETPEKTPEPPPKVKLYRGLRRGVSALRSHLKPPPKNAETNPVP